MNAAQLRDRFALRSEAISNDAGLLLAILASGGASALDRVLGSVAAIVCDETTQELRAWRSRGSEQPLFVASRPGLAAAASRPEGLFSHPKIERRLDFDAAAAWAGQVASPGEQSLFEGVRRVLPGQMLSVMPGCEPFEVVRARPSRIIQRALGFDDAAAGLRSVLAAAVRDCLDDGSVAGTLLSAGRDSSAVTALSSEILRARSERLVAFTGAPTLGVPALPMPGCIADESTIAAATAARFPNVDHRICRAQAGSFLKDLSSVQLGATQPIGNVANWPWYWACASAARKAGVTIMVTGAAGNHTISTGGRDFLADVMREQGLAAAARAAIGSAGASGQGWLGIARLALGPHLPPWLVEQILRASGRLQAIDNQVPTLRAPFRQTAEQRFVDSWSGSEALGFDRRISTLAAFDNAENLAPATLGYSERDPTRDPRVIDFILSLPAEVLLPRPGNPRPLYAAAFADLLPEAITKSTARGYQGADWDSHFPVADVAARFAELLQHPLNAELFDRDFIRDAVGRRPRSPEALVTGPVMHLHRNQLLGALGVADWIAGNFPAA